MQGKKRLVVGNWKMNPLWLEDAKYLLSAANRTAPRLTKTSVVVCPPFVYLSALTATSVSKNLYFGAQDTFWERRGSYTGEVSPDSLFNLGCDYVIVGHSERRALGETNEDVSKKVAAAVRADIRPIICVGESERDEHGHYFSFIRDQITGSLSDMTTKNLEHVCIAYEPIWAIGKSAEDAIDVRELQTMALFITKTLSELFSRSVSESIPILYGGSAEPENVQHLFVHGGVDGFLVGHESLDADGFRLLLSNVDQA